MENLEISASAAVGKRIFLRADLNIPLKNGVIVDDQRLHALLPTLRLLEQTATTIVIATHLGKPDPENPDSALSTKQLVSWFAQQQLPVVFAATPEQAASLTGTHKLVLLENLRFFPGEQEPSAVTPLDLWRNLSASFARKLKELADIYVTDAFGTLHRNDTSISLLPRFFAPKQRFYGLCVAHELAGLTKLRTAPQPPFVAIIGGNKIATKLPLIQQLITAAPEQRVTHVLLGGLLGERLEKTAPNLIALAKKQHVTLLTPSDYRIDHGGNKIDIGPKTIEIFSPYLRNAKTILANGTMGKYEDKDGQEGTFAVLEIIGHNAGFTVIGGGDCAAAAAQCGVAKKVTFVSTGGGATLAFIASKEPWHDLPGLQALIATE